LPAFAKASARLAGLAGLFILTVPQKRMAKPNPPAAERLRLVFKGGFQTALNPILQACIYQPFYFF
jgi:hypothetical protein